MITKVTKRDGTVVDFDPNKLNALAEWSSAHGSDWSDLVVKTCEKLYEGISTAGILKALIETCESYRDSKHLKYAARLLRGDLYKTVYGSYEARPFNVRYKELVESGAWADYVHSPEELEVFSKEIDHSLDDTYEYSALLQFIDKYAVSVFKDGKAVPVETPQEALMGVAITVFKEVEEQAKRIDLIVGFYKILSKRLINLATPILTNARTGRNSFASCCLIKMGDSLEGVSTANSIAYKMTASGAGIGMHVDVRSVGDVVGNNKCKHAGKIPHYRMLHSTTASVRQGRGRNGANNITFDVLDPEIIDLLNLKRPTAHPVKRLVECDYTVNMNSSFLRRAAKGLEWLLVSKAVAPELHRLFYEGSEEEFEEEMARQVAKGVGKVVSARSILKEYLEARGDTGRVYDVNVSEANWHTPFKERITQSNLCLEILLPTKAYSKYAETEKSTYREGDGVTALCYLIAFDVAKIKNEEEYQECAYYASAALDRMMEMMDYPFKQLRATANGYKSVGCGILNLAYLMAKRGLKYSEDTGKAFIERVAENHYYQLLKASVRIAKERGKFEFYDKTKWGAGWLPIDTMNEFSKQGCLTKDWESLRNEIAKHGVRFSCLVAHPPCESSSVFSGATNGVYPIRDKIVLKKRGEGLVPFLVPNAEELGSAYENAYDIPTKDLMECYALLQKYTDQAISADEYIDYTKQKDRKVSMKETMQNFLYAKKLGVKTSYYKNFKTGMGEEVAQQEEEGGCAGGACKM